MHDADEAIASGTEPESRRLTLHPPKNQRRASCTCAALLALCPRQVTRSTRGKTQNPQPNMAGCTLVGGHGCYNKILNSYSTTLTAVVWCTPTLARRAASHVGLAHVMIIMQACVYSGGARQASHPSRAVMYGHRNLYLWHNDTDSVLDV
jgi:hypothetical protein